MVKNLGRGFFYTIGRILAIIFLGFLIGTLLLKFPSDTNSLPDFLKGAIM